MKENLGNFDSATEKDFFIETLTNVYHEFARVLNTFSLEFLDKHNFEDNDFTSQLSERNKKRISKPTTAEEEQPLPIEQQPQPTKQQEEEPQQQEECEGGENQEDIKKGGNKNSKTQKLKNSKTQKNH